MANHFDVIVLGLGAMGSATVCDLARKGLKVLGIDQFTPPHTLGSSHGQTRIIREAYFEHPAYVPLVQRAYELWDRLERESGRKLLVKTGGLMIGAPESVVPRGALRSAEEHHLPHEVLSGKEVRRRFPALQPEEGMIAVFEPRAGILFPEACIAAHLETARGHGAEILLETTVVDWVARESGVRIQTANGAFEAGKLVISAGAWVRQLIPDLAGLFRVERQILFWFEPRGSGEVFETARCPVHLWEYEPGKFFYGFPNLGEGVKIARHHLGQSTAPEMLDREVHAAEIEDIRGILGRFLPGANGRFLSATVCMYTNTPDEHFLIDFHPEHGNVLIVSPCSGHGFKFSSAVGELAAGLITGSVSPERTPSIFRFGREGLSR